MNSILCWREGEEAEDEGEETMVCILCIILLSILSFEGSRGSDHLFNSYCRFRHQKQEHFMEFPQQ